MEIKPPIDPLLTPADIARQLKVTTHQVYAWVRSGELSGTKLGHRTIRVHKSSVDALIARGAFDATS